MLKRQFAVGLLAGIAALSMPRIAAAVDLDTTPEANAENPDFAAGRKAVERKNWNEAVKRFSRVAEKEPANADAHNMLGYSLRWQGNVDAAIASYERALKLNPKHRGALEYSGIAFVKSGNVARAQENLAKLKDICGVNCDEYKDLAKAIAENPAAKR